MSRHDIKVKCLDCNATWEIMPERLTKHDEGDHIQCEDCTSFNIQTEIDIFDCSECGEKFPPDLGYYVEDDESETHARTTLCPECYLGFCKDGSIKPHKKAKGEII